MTVVHYHCNPHQSMSVIQDQSLSSREPLQIWVESVCACPNACAVGDLGLGTIFLIILSFSAAAYFLLGNGLNPISNPNLTTYKMQQNEVCCYILSSCSLLSRSMKVLLGFKTTSFSDDVYCRSDVTKSTTVQDESDSEQIVRLYTSNRVQTSGHAHLIFI